MLKEIQREIIWQLGLDERETADVLAVVGDEFDLRPWPGDGDLSAIPPHAEEAERPLLALVSVRTWSAMPSQAREDFEMWDGCPKALVQDGRIALLRLEDFLERGFLTVLRTPVSRSRLRETVMRAQEARGLCQDILRMTSEIMLERELLVRKTDQLMFLNRLLSRAAESLDVASILAGARDDLNMLFKVVDMHGVFWQPLSEQASSAPESLGLGDDPHASLDPGLELELFIGEGLGAAEWDAWTGYLMDCAARLSGRRVESYRAAPVPRDGTGWPPVGGVLGPVEGRVLLLPLKTRQTVFGSLAVLADDRLRLAGDQLETVRSAVSHLTLALKNALLFREMKLLADHDGLTRIHNRRCFDERLLDELRRHQRYDLDLSLLLLDIDHFKRINDAHGHQAGDEILREVAAVLRGCLRSTDFAARYGGEEFVIILPHTGGEQAWMLAERIRRVIAKRLFQWGGQRFRLTVSIGVASLDAGVSSTRSDLVRQADLALYMAKTSGRNIVRHAADASEADASSK